MEINAIANRLNSYLPFFLRNHGRCRGGAYISKRLYGEKADAVRVGPMYDGKRALLRKDWPAAKVAFERSIDDNPINAKSAAVLCDDFDKGELALKLIKYGEKSAEPGYFANLRNILADAHRKHYRTCHRASDSKLANDFERQP